MFFKRILSLMLIAVLLVTMTSCSITTTAKAVTIQETETMKTTLTESIIETEPEETEMEYIEKIPEVPLYNQLDYYETRYGDSTISLSGCGIVCYAMVLSYLLDREILPDELVRNYHKYKVERGSSYALFLDTQEEWGVTVDHCYWGEAWEEGKLMEALENGQLVIANVREDSVFTDNGHFIVLYGLTEDGKILVRDPYGGNYGRNDFLIDGFENGFAPEYFRKISASYFIYPAKDLNAIASKN